MSAKREAPEPRRHEEAGAGLDAEASEAALRHLNQIDLARRWRISPRTLERWRWERVGPPWLRVGGRVLYRLEDILAYERARLEAPGGTPPHWRP